MDLSGGNHENMHDCGRNSSPIQYARALSSHGGMASAGKGQGA
jgi:hypothetical protein